MTKSGTAIALPIICLGCELTFEARCGRVSMSLRRGSQWVLARQNMISRKPFGCRIRDGSLQNASCTSSQDRFVLGKPKLRTFIQILEWWSEGVKEWDVCQFYHPQFNVKSLNHVQQLTSTQITSIRSIIHYTTFFLSLLAGTAASADI